MCSKLFKIIRLSSARGPTWQAVLDLVLKGFTCNLTLSHFLGRTSQKNHPVWISFQFLPLFVSNQKKRTGPTLHLLLNHNEPLPNGMPMHVDYPIDENQSPMLEQSCLHYEDFLWHFLPWKWIFGHRLFDQYSNKRCAFQKGASL